MLEFGLCEYLDRAAGARAACKRIEHEFSGGGSIFTGMGTVTSPWWAPPRTLLETEETVADTVALAETLTGADVDVAGFYPIVQMVLPGAALTRGRRQLDVGP